MGFVLAVVFGGRHINTPVSECAGGAEQICVACPSFGQLSLRERALCVAADLMMHPYCTLAAPTPGSWIPWGTLSERRRRWSQRVEQTTAGRNQGGRQTSWGGPASKTQ